MAVLTLTGARTTGLLAGTSGIQTLGDVGMTGARVRVVFDTVEAAAPDDTSTIWLARLPSHCRLIWPYSRVWWDDLASIGSATIDVGTFNPTGYTGLTDDPNSLYDAGDAATAQTYATGIPLIIDHANIYKRLWEHAGASADPKQPIDIKATVVDANANLTGTVTWVIAYTID